jgi:outer membrane protein TolC
MDRARPFAFARLLTPRRLAARLCAAGLPLLALGWTGPARAGAVPAAMLPAPQPAAAPAAPQGPETLPTPTQLSQAPPPGAHAQSLPVSMDTIFRLAQDQNTQVQLARERVRGACADLDVATLGWLPHLYVGPAWYRHEGGISDEVGQLVHSSYSALFGGLEVDGLVDLRAYAYQKVKAEREVWQQRSELSRINYDTLSEASSAYIDLLLARSAEDVARELEEEQQKLIAFVQGLDKGGYKAELDTLEADLRGYHQLVLRARQDQRAASARLAYLLGLDPCTALVPVDDRLQAFALIDASAPACELTTRALAAGPGVREAEGMLRLIQNSIAQSQGPSRFLPTFEVRMAEGVFGTGPGDDMRWDNRWDLALQARWDLSALAAARDRQRSAESRLRQADLNLRDVRAKLASGVEEAHDAVLNTRDQLPHAAERVRYSKEAYKVHYDLRMNYQNAQEVLIIIRELIQNVRTLREVRSDYLQTLSAYDKAQLRLLLLLGPTAPPPAAPRPCGP